MTVSGSAVRKRVGQWGNGSEDLNRDKTREVGVNGENSVPGSRRSVEDKKHG